MSGELGSFFSFLVVLAILNSVVAGTQAGFNGTTRVLFAMARAGTMPAVLSKVHPKHRTPYVAAITSAIIALAAMLGASMAFDGAFGGFIFFLTVLTLVFIGVYIVICIGTPVYFLRRRRSEFNPLLHAVAPAIGLIVLVPTLYYSAKGLESPASTAIPALLIWMGLGVIVLLVMRARGHDISGEAQYWLREDLGETANPALGSEVHPEH